MPTDRRKPARPVIGWREWVALPELDVPTIRAKIDTGARSAALHAFGLELVERDGVTLARFAVHPDHRSPGPAVVVETPVIEEKLVRNPGGRSELRPVIRTTLQLGEVSFPAEVTLTRRDEMGFPMLLGRQTIRRRFVVDPGRSYLVGNPPAEASSPEGGAATGSG